MVIIRKDYIEPSALKRPQTKQTVKYLTIHSTGNPKSSAKNERDNLARATNTRQASFHIVVDEKEAVQCMPFNEVAFHAGDGQGNGNRASIGLEICEGGNRKTVLKNAAQVAASILKTYDLPISKMVQHSHWSGKNCPRILRDPDFIKDKMNWGYFIELVNKELEGNKVPKIESGQDALNKLVSLGIIDSPNYWLKVMEVVKNFDLFLIKIANKL